MSRSSFTTPLIVSPLPDGRKWRLFRQFTYHIGSRYSQRKITVPEGFVTDFASVPFFAWCLIPKWGKYGKAAVVHDYLYQYGALSRKQADEVFREAMGILGVVPWRRFLMYWAVRLFGWAAYRERAQELLPANNAIAPYDRFSNYSRRTDI